MTGAESNVNDVILTTELLAAQAKGHWRAPGGELRRVSWNAERLPATPEGPHLTPPSDLNVRDARRRGNVHALATVRGRVRVRNSRVSMRKDSSEGEGAREPQIAAATCHVARNAIFTHGMRASPRKYRAPGWPAGRFPHDDSERRATVASRRTTLVQSAPITAVSGLSGPSAPRVSSRHATTQRRPSNVTHIRHVVTATPAPSGGATEKLRRSDGRAARTSNAPTC